MNTTTATIDATTELTALINRLQANWTPTSGASATLRKGSSTRLATIPKESKHDLWIWSGRTNSQGELALLGRIDCRDLGKETNLIPAMAGWEVQA